MLKIKLHLIKSKVELFLNKEKFDTHCIKKYKLDYTEDTRAGLALELEKDRLTYLIYIDGTQNKKWQKRTAVHEISHIVDFVMSSHGFNCTEFRAYLTGYLYAKAIKYIDKKEVEK